MTDCGSWEHRHRNTDSSVTPEVHITSTAQRITSSAIASSCSTRLVAVTGAASLLLRSRDSTTSEQREIRTLIYFFFLFFFMPEAVGHQNIAILPAVWVPGISEMWLPSLGQNICLFHVSFWGEGGGKLVRHMWKGLEILSVFIYLLFTSKHTQTHKRIP
jgi:hypothetical protein